MIGEIREMTFTPCVTGTRGEHSCKQRTTVCTSTGYQVKIDYVISTAGGIFSRPSSAQSQQEPGD